MTKQERVQWLLRLFPSAWRMRYEEEFTELLLQQRLGPFVLLDVIMCVLDAHLHPEFSGPQYIPGKNPYRAPLLAGFCAYIVFVLAGMAFYGMVDDSPYLKVMHQGGSLHWAWNITADLAGLTLLAMLAGGVPIVLVALRQAFKEKRKDLLLLLALPLFALVSLIVIYGGTILIILLMGGSHLPQSGTQLIVSIWSISFIIAAVVSVAGTCLAITRSAVGISLFKFARYPGIITTAAMALVVGGIVWWGISAGEALPQVFAGNLAGWVAIVAVMALATLVAGFSAARSFSIHNQTS
ncbi:MAG TPA: hypothetical protein VH186_03305 [Chloroflexia bacterium]|nr:hypothetical protein [Chloroflexia bacterium]